MNNTDIAGSPVPVGRSRGLGSVQRLRHCFNLVIVWCVGPEILECLADESSPLFGREQEQARPEVVSQVMGKRAEYHTSRLLGCN